MRFPRNIRAGRTRVAEATVPDPGTALVLASSLNHPELVARASKELQATGRVLERDYLALSPPRPRLSYFFDPGFYLARNEDVARAGVDPYLHFLAHGLAEGRNPHPLVDLRHMATRAGDPADVARDPEALAVALRGNAIDPHPAFEIAYYLECNRDVREAGLSALEHYIAHGAAEGRAPNPEFLADWYLEANPDLPGDRYQAFVHYLLHGAAEGRAPGPGTGSSGTGSSGAGVAVPARAGAPSPIRDHAPAAAVVEGQLDDTRDHVAHGWAFAPDAPDARLEVEIVSQGQLVGLGVADRFRADLKAAGKGDGHHAFSIRLSGRLRDGGRHRLRARVRGSSALLPGEPVVHVADATPAPFDLVPRDVALEFAARSMPQAIGEDWQASLEKACLQLDTGDWKGGLSAWEALATGPAGVPLVLAKQAEARLGLGEADLALPLYEQALAAGEPSEWWWLGLGNAKRLLGQWQEAAAAYEAGLRLAPDNPFLQARSAQVAVHDRLMEARGMLADGRARDVLGMLAPLLVRQPGDRAIEDLVVQAHDAARGPSAEGMWSGLKQARRALDLLESVVSHLEREEAA